MSLYILDTDILSLYQRGHPQVTQRVSSRPLAELGITVITVEEQLSGWFTLLRRARGRDQVARAYQNLAASIPFLARWPIFSFTTPSIIRFDQLLKMKLKIRAMDLRIAAIALENGRVLVSRNRRDFQRVPGLLLEDWTT